MKKIFSVMLMAIVLFAFTACDDGNYEIPKDPAPFWLSGEWKLVGGSDTFNIESYMAMLDDYDKESINPERMMIDNENTYEVYWAADSRNSGKMEIADPAENLRITRRSSTAIFIERQSATGDKLILESKGIYSKVETKE